jgi:hypothetical protein
MDQQNTGVGRAVEPDDRTTEIRAEINRTREDLSETVDAIQDRLRPSSLASSAADRVKQATSETMHELAESDTAYYVNENRLPIAMIGVGIAGAIWLSTRGDGRAHHASWRGGPRYDQRYDQWNSPAYRRSATEAGIAASDPNPGAYDYPADRAFDQPQQFSRGYSRSAQRVSRPSYFQRAWRANPLLVGAAAAAIGAIVGLGVPETERENELMGEARDSVVSGISETVRSKVDQVQHAATDAVSTVQNAAKQVAGLTSDEARPARTPTTL